MKARAGGQILADQLKIQGVDRIFCLPGESFLGLLDGLFEHRDSIHIVTTRHEGGAANMAEAHGKMTGRPGICLVTRGPGASNASIGIHTAFQDSTPLILLIGQVGRKTVDREAFQEIDYRRMFGQMAKWVAQIDDAARIPEYIGRAFYTAMSGRPGPVVLALPEDMLRDKVQVADVKRAQAVHAAPSPDAIEELRAHLQAAERPLLIVGGATWTAEAVRDITQFSEANRLPVAATFRCQDCFDNRHEHYIGDLGLAINPKLSERIKSSDLLIVAGPRLGEISTSGYSLIEIPTPRQKLIHIHSGVEELGRVYSPTLAINSSMTELARALRAMPPVDGGRWQNSISEAREQYLSFIVPGQVPGELNFGEIVSFLSKTLPEDAIVSNGAGNHTVWIHRYFMHKIFRTQIAPTSGAMGYSVPAAIAAKLAAPERTVVSFNGDGCFQIFGQELATAIQYEANVIFIVVNNGMLGTIRMHQERNYPGRVIATDLKNPDFVALAQAYGVFGERVTRTADFPDAFERAANCGKASLLELVADPEALTVSQSLSEIRENAAKNL
ncbi:MAG: thiamine pyrophosphate-binding protein [SAR324 cluster bacterium]|nr:thiamine pyrophosphate-binding protein [SAR324 cluster bacterium]